MKQKLRIKENKDDFLDYPVNEEFMPLNTSN